MISKSAFKARVQESSAGSSIQTIPDELLDKVCGGNGPGDFRDMFTDGPTFTDTFLDFFPCEDDSWSLPQTPKPPTENQDEVELSHSLDPRPPDPIERQPGMQFRCMTLGGVLSAVVIALVAQAASSLAHAEPGAAAARQATIAQQPPSAELRYDESGRPVISTQVNGKGPFDMVVDTAAQTTFLAPGLVEELQLTPLQTDQNISGASGQAQVRTYPLSSLSSDLFSVEGTVAPGLPNASVTQARGVIGMDLFLQRRLVFDREAGRLFATSSGTTGAGFASHAGRAFAGNFIIVPVMLDGVPVQAVIDSGAARTIANDAARSALGYTENDPRLRQTHAVRGATEDATEAHRASVAVFEVGPARFGDVSVTFSNLPVFRVLGLADQPALILGSDVLNRLPA